MEKDWSLIDEIEEDAPISEEVGLRVGNCAPAGCLICAIEDWDE